MPCASCNGLMSSISSIVMSTNQKRLKILMIAPTSFFSDYGGHIRIYEETLALQALGHQVIIVTYYKGRDLEGIDIRRTAPLPYHTDYEVGSSRHKLAFDVYLAWRALRVAWREKPDVIHGHMHEGALIGKVLAKLMGVPLVFDFQGSLTGEMVDHGFLAPGSWVFRFVRRLERWICQHAGAILTSSLRARELLEKEFAVPPAQLVPLPDCVDTERFRPDQFTCQQRQSLRAHLGIPADRPLVVYLGFLAPYQGTDHLIRMAAALKAAGAEIYFLIMGFPNVERYKRLARQLDVADRVIFTGKLPYQMAPRYLHLGDVAVSAKTSSTEGSGKVLNYMAMALPVVAYDNPVHVEYLAESGVYVPLGDEAAFAEAIRALTSDPAHRQRLGGQLRARAIDEYSWQAAAGRIVRTYERLRERQPAAGQDDRRL